LGDLYGGCREAILQRGGEVRLRCGIREIRIRGNRFVSVAMDDGYEVSADACIVAVPHDALLNLLPREMSEGNGSLAGLRNIKTSPITGVHLWYDRTVMTEPFLTLLDHTTQWVFNKTLLYKTAETDGTNVRPTGQSAQSSEAGADGQYLQLVISASYGLVPQSRQEIIDLCRRELAEVLPATREAQLRKATVIKEVNATFSPEPGVDRWRPPQKSSVDNLFLAGDWTRTSWPATMEGAVRSGYLAAEALLAEIGEPAKFLQPDMPFEGLSKFWADRSNQAGS
jgi:zeta-carotene desaturase